MNQIQNTEYLSRFSDRAKRRSALKEARENRKFEIELYWKRAAYFWTFTAATFAGFFVLQKTTVSTEAISATTISYLVACLGFVFSIAWYFVNRGSKYWQQNWELHVDLLEEEFFGPIYKTVVQPNRPKFFDYAGAYPFSVSKINQILSLFVASVWLILIGALLAADQHCQWAPRYSIIAISIAAAMAVIALISKGRTTDAEGNSIIASIYERHRTHT